MENEVRKLVWDSLLAADYRARYYGDLAGYLADAGRWLTIANLVLSSGAVAALLSTAHKGIAAAAMVAVAIVSAVQLVQKYGDRASDAAELAGEWMGIQRDLELLWSQIDERDPQSTRAEWAEIEARHTRQDKRAAKEFGYLRWLGKRAWREMLVARGLPEATS